MIDYAFALMCMMLGFGAGLLLEFKNWQSNMLHKADTGIRIEVKGRLFVIREVEVEK